MKKLYCSYCGELLTEECDCERIAAIRRAEMLEDYYDSPEVQAGWRQEDMIWMRRREQ